MQEGCNLHHFKDLKYFLILSGNGFDPILSNTVLCIRFAKIYWWLTLFLNKFSTVLKCSRHVMFLLLLDSFVFSIALVHMLSFILVVLWLIAEACFCVVVLLDYLLSHSLYVYLLWNYVLYILAPFTIFKYFTPIIFYESTLHILSSLKDIDTHLFYTQFWHWKLWVTLTHIKTKKMNMSLVW